MSDKEIIEKCKKQIWYKVMCELLTSRRYNKQETFKVIRYKQRISIIFTKANAINHFLTIIFDHPPFLEPNTNINKDIMSKIYIPYITDSCTNGLLIVSQSLPGKNIQQIFNTCSLVSSLKSQSKLPGITDIELWLYNQLTINPLKHSLTPKHSLLTNTQQIELLKKYDVKSEDISNKLPLISKKDAIIRWYNWPKGKIVKIEREEGNITYKYIVD